MATNWPTTFTTVSDSVFGTPPWSGRYFLRAGVAANASATLVLCLSSVLYPGIALLRILLLVMFAPLVVASLVLLGCASGYVACLITRALLHKMGQTQAFSYRCGWLVVHSLITVALALLACMLGFLVVYAWGKADFLPTPWLIGYLEFVLGGLEGGRSAVAEALRLQPIVVPGGVFPSFGLWFYVPCFPAVWLWLYVLSGTLLRYVLSWRILHVNCEQLGRLDRPTKPLATLGVVAILLVSALYWGAVLALR